MDGYKFIDKEKLETALTATASAIRAKTGSSDSISFDLDGESGFGNAVENMDVGYKINDWLDKTKPIGKVNSDRTTFYPYELYGRTGITEVSIINAVKIPDNFCASCTNLSKIYATEATNIGVHAFQDTQLNGTVFFPKAQVNTATFRRSKFTYAIIKTIVSSQSNTFTSNSNLIGVDVTGEGATLGGNQNFRYCSNFNILILRSSTIVGLASLNLFSDTPFASGKSGGTLYVPSTLISSYQAASNWSTLLGYTNNQIKAIEGSIYESNYVDGTPITTS